MIDHVWTVVCSRTVFDRDSGNVSIQNVLEQLSIFAEPSPDAMLAIEFEVVSFWVRTDINVPAQGRYRLVVLTPSTQPIGTTEVEINLLDNERHKQRIQFQQFPAREEGRHIFRVELQLQGEDSWRQVASIPLRLVFLPPPDEAPQT